MKLYQGDCLEVMKQIPDESVDMILCDLPYGTTACKWDTVMPFDKLWEQYNRIIKNNGAIVLFGSEPFSSALRMSNIKKYKYDWVWVKQQGTNPNDSEVRAYLAEYIFCKVGCILGTMKYKPRKGSKK